MKADKEILAELASNIERELCNLTDRVLLHKRQILNASSVERVMEEKKRLLLAWVALMPLSDDECYFCLLGRRETDEEEFCTRCPYAKHHGVCERINDSSWCKINDLRWKLYDLIDEEYYREGERYESRSKNKG